MAIFPCNIGYHRYPQPQQSAYCTILDGDDAATYRARLCPKHFRAIWESTQQHLAPVTEDSLSTDRCDACGEPKEVMAFARIFPSKEDERVYAADLCQTHTDGLLIQLQIALWERLGSR